MSVLERLEKAYEDAETRPPEIRFDEVMELTRHSQREVVQAVRTLSDARKAHDAPAEKAAILQLIDAIIEEHEIEAFLDPATRWLEKEAFYHGCALGLNFAGRPDMIREFPAVATALWTLDNPRRAELLRIVHGKKP